jgi:hypothetical protein
MAFVPPKQPKSGFQNTVNHYGVGMWNRDNNNIQQWMKIDFTAYEDGRVDAPITMENNTYFAFKGSIRVIARDAAGNLLLDVISPECAIGSKNPLHATEPNRATIGWSFTANPAVGINGADLYAVPANYDGDNLPLNISFGQLVELTAMVVQYVAA